MKGRNEWERMWWKKVGRKKERPDYKKKTKEREKGVQKGGGQRTYKKRIRWMRREERRGKKKK